MPKFRNGLARVGRVYHYKFTWKGRSYHGSTGCEQRSMAEQVLQKIRQDLVLERAGLKPVQRTFPTLAQTLEDWTKSQNGAAADRHVANVRSSILLHLKPLLALPLDQIDNQAVEDARTAYLNSTGTGHRPGQKGEWELSHTLGGANKVVQHLSSVLGWAVRRRQGGLEKMPFKVKPLKPEPQIKSVLWPELVPTFLQETLRGRRYAGQAFPHTHTAILMMLTLGLREGEASSATWEQLDRRRKIFKVYGHDRELREIPVTAALLDHLDRVWGPSTALPSGPIIPGHGRGFTQKAVARGGAKVGLPDLHPHWLRASFATTHYEAGTPLTQIQQMMGHEDPETTMRYIVQRPKDQAESQERVSTLMGFQVPGSPDQGTIRTTAQDENEKPLKNKAKTK